MRQLVSRGGRAEERISRRQIGTTARATSPVGRGFAASLKRTNASTCALRRDQPKKRRSGRRRRYAEEARWVADGLEFAASDDAYSTTRAHILPVGIWPSRRRSPDAATKIISVSQALDDPKREGKTDDGHQRERPL